MSKNEPKEHGMIFTGQSIPALLNLAVGDEAKPINPSKPFKWVTRRIVTRQPGDHIMSFRGVSGEPTGEYGLCDYPMVISKHIKPAHPLGTVIWIRETWMPEGADSRWELMKQGVIPPDIIFRADREMTMFKWHSPLHLPKWAARPARFRVASVRPERVQDITYNDVLAEGLDFLTDEQQTDASHKAEAKAAFAALWNKLHRKDHPWGSNPWVWRYELRRIA